MSFNIKKIIEAWIISFNPTTREKELAEKRAEICKNCDSRTLKIGVPICGECGCPIAKKIFTNEYNPCDLHKWKDIDELYYEIKTKKTLM